MKLFKDSTNEMWAFELDGSQDHLIRPDMVSVTEEEADAITHQKQLDQYNALSYAEKRAAEYPSITDQLDLIYHGGIESWKEVIDTIKTKYPKG